MFYHSPLGIIKITISAGYINELIYIDEESASLPETIKLSTDDNKVLKKCIAQFDEYFSGKRKIFNLTVKQNGTSFQQKVWNELIKIPYGKTIRYLQLAQRLGDEKSIRAAASANGRNKLNIVVPCHRVIGSDGTLV
ncbi:MAG TPA: methylated-DNA--[protein]-cysteine S-methyltransferase, partial [Ginsengibacter sp.]|nr:methylated-DNA--[protein]-cysteine S-methyltransferase [Ginsengibacter sp.]